MAKDKDTYALRTEVIKDSRKLAQTLLELEQRVRITESEKAAIKAIEPVLRDLVNAINQS